MKQAFDYTELGNAKRFVKVVGDDYKWVPEVKGWYKWNNTQWAEDKVDSVMLEIENVLDWINLEVLSLRHDFEVIDAHPNARVKDSVEFDKRKATLIELDAAWSWHQRSQSARAIREMVNLAKSQNGMTSMITDFDSKGHYIGCKNGIVDLRDGSLIVNDKRYLITKSVNVEYDENAQCNTWEEQLLKYMSDNKEYVQFLQVLLGSSLVGHKSKWFTMFYGDKGGNGKSTIVDTVSAIMGEYAKVGDPKVLLGGQGNKSEYYLASFKGTRLLIFNESDKEEVQMSEHLIKMVTDSGEVQARHPAGRPFEYQPIFTPVFCVNHLPTVSMDPAVWRRLLILPFDYQIPLEDQDSQFTEKLIRLEGSGILNWLVEGAKVFLREGLNPPDSLKAQTQTLREEGDTLTQFIEQCCTITNDESDKVQLNVLRKLYITWLLDEGYKKAPASQRFARDLRDCDFEVRKSNGGVNYVFGIREGKQLYAVSDNSDGSTKRFRELFGDE